MQNGRKNFFLNTTCKAIVSLAWPWRRHKITYKLSTRDCFAFFERLFSYLEDFTSLEIFLPLPKANVHLGYREHSKGHSVWKFSRLASLVFFHLSKREKRKQVTAAVDTLRSDSMGARINRFLSQPSMGNQV